jgi:hypothetical protein
VSAAPPSLRVYILSKALGAPIVDVLAEDYALMRELECITAASAEAERRRHAAQQRQHRRRKGKR